MNEKQTMEQFKHYAIYTLASVAILLLVAIAVLYYQSTFIPTCPTCPNGLVTKDEASAIMTDSVIALAGNNVTSVNITSMNETGDYYFARFIVTWNTGNTLDSYGFLLKDGKYFTNSMWSVDELEAKLNTPKQPVECVGSSCKAGG